MDMPIITEKTDTKSHCQLPAKYDSLGIADECNQEQFQDDLKKHQQGKSNYLTFINRSAELGIKKWEVCMQKMTCTYFDKAENEVLTEEIPAVK